jgi:hypothetical protein
MGEGAVSTGTKVAEIVCLTISTIILVITIFLATVANALPDPSIFGFLNDTGSLQEEGQYNPAPWVFTVVWITIFICQLTWVIYGWTYTCRPNTVRSIHWSVYIPYTFANATGIVWLYVWGNAHDIAAYPVIMLYALGLYITFGMEAVYLYKVTPNLTNKVDLWFTRIAVLNSIAIYCTWLTLANLLSIGGLINRYSSFGAPNTATLIFSFLLGELVLYFILENTILDRFFRYVLIVYPLVILAVIGVVNANWLDYARGEDALRSAIYSTILLVVAIIVFVVRIVLFGLFSCFRPTHKKTYNKV